MKRFMLSVACILFFATLYGQEQQPMIGQPAPPFQLKSLDGKTFSLEDLKGKFVVVHFAATWCPFCNAEAPYLEALYQNYHNKNVEVVVVDVNEDQALVQKWEQRFNLSFPVLLDEDGSVSATYAPEGVQPDLSRSEVPIAANLIIDKAGKIQFYSLLNSLAFDAKLTKLTEKLDQLINESTGK